MKWLLKISRSLDWAKKEQPIQSKLSVVKYSIWIILWDKLSKLKKAYLLLSHRSRIKQHLGLCTLNAKVKNVVNNFRKYDIIYLITIAENRWALQKRYWSIFGTNKIGNSKKEKIWKWKQLRLEKINVKIIKYWSVCKTNFTKKEIP